MNAITVISFLVFTGIVGIVAWMQSRKARLHTLSGLFLANRSLGFLLIGGGLVFTNINTATILGENELTYTHNLSVMAWGMTSVLAMLLVSEYFTPIYLKTGISTTPEFLALRYDLQTARLVSVIFLVSYVVNLLPSVLYSGAVAFNGLFHFSTYWGTDYWTTIWILVWILGSVGGLYTLMGGLKAISVSDTLLGLGIFAGGLILPYFGLRYLGGGHIAAGLHLLLTVHTDHLNSIGRASDPVPFSTLFTGMLLVNLYYWGTEQYIVQQVLASRDLRSCQQGIALACLGKIVSPLLLNVPGLIAVHLLTHVHNTAEVFPELNRLVTPSLVSGYVAAIIFGAALTTFNAGLNSSGTLFVLNLYKPWAERRRGPIPERSLVRVAKRFELGVCFCAMSIAPFILLARGGFYNYVQLVNGFFNVPIFTILFMGFVTRRVPAVAAKAGLAFFIGSYGVIEIFGLTRLHFLHLLAILFVVTCVLMWSFGRLWPMAEPYRLRVNNVVAVTPWRHRHWAALILLLMMVAMFIIFSPLGLAR